MKKTKRRRNGEGSIFQRQDGRWTAELTEGRKRKVIYAATAEDVLEKLARARNQQLDNVPFTPEKLTVANWLNVWLRNVRPPTTRPKSYQTYESHVRLHLIPHLGHIRLAKLQPQDIRDFMTGRLEAGFSATTVKDLRAVLRTALNQAINDDLIPRNATKQAKPPEEDLRMLDVYTPAEARQLIEAAQGHRLEAMFTTAIGLALRKGEIRGLQWTDIDFPRGLLTVRHNLQRVKRVHCADGEPKTELLLGRPKSKKKKLDPALKLPPIVLEALERHQAAQAEERLLCGSAWRGDGKYVFTTHLGSPLEHLDREFHAVCDLAGLRRIRFHDLRHSAASILIAQGVHPKAIQELLRHSSIQLTMDIYGHLFDHVRQETADKMEAVLRGTEDAVTVKTDVKTDVKPANRRPN